ncbi:hypothetical protein K2X14_04850 [Acetobacter sp. TBRC 12305]|uniref:Uncharacterized protein n=1 Tax=Acetobacter garciniae TaxID=2817435 RepID=A0A939HJA5_9PROT|nr:hypothetical protein [Acetobacter garciniae]MBO1324482.1 hypothetical protein [Acetobacter garciniae]MBX0344171.1 hypothetical protein [Acetobacter garciniae]
MSCEKKISRVLGCLLLTVPLLAACHVPIEGDNIDLPPERPGRFLPEAAEAEGRAAQKDVERQERLAAEQDRLAGRKPGEPRTPPKPEDQYEVVAPESGGVAGPIRLSNGHTIIPQTQTTYGKPGNVSSQGQNSQ